MSDQLKEGTATVTGAASGIGRAIAIAFARDGCRKLVLGDLNLSGLEETQSIIVEKYPATMVQTHYLDVGDEAVVESYYRAAVKKFGRIDFAVNVAGYEHRLAPAHELPTEEFDRSFHVNQRGVFLCERAELRQMLKQEPLTGFECRGSIINITSLCATAPMNNLVGYSASKGGALGLSKCDAFDYGPDKIRINCVAPGYIATPILRTQAAGEVLRKMASAIPLRRVGEPEDVANAVVWLSSPRAAFITGVSLTVDGGLNLLSGPP